MSRGGRWIRVARRRAIYERDAHRCIYCGLGPRTPIFTLGLTLDHLASRADHTTRSLATACIHCNSAKRDMSMHAWLKRCDARGYDVDGIRRRLRRIRRS